MSETDRSRIVPGTEPSERLVKPRKHYSEFSQAAILVCLLAVCCAGRVPKNGLLINCLETCVWLIRVVSALVVAEILRRMCYLMEEKQHLASRYRNSIYNLWLRFFSSNAKIGLMTFILFMRFIIELKDVETLDWGLDVIIIWSYIFFHLLVVRTNHVYYSVDDRKGLGYGSGMAQSYYFGYLRLILPDTGDSEKGIVERIDDYISQHGLDPSSFPIKKLFILIPVSSYIPNDLRDVSYNWMTCAESLEEQEKNRAGVNKRKYKNTVYRIKDPNDATAPYTYVVAEGATPLKTFHEVVQFSGTRKELYEANQPEIIFSFYETLRETLSEHKECRDLCELIYYDDTDEYGNNVNVAHLILKRIKDIQNQEKLRSRI